MKKLMLKATEDNNTHEVEAMKSRSKSSDTDVHGCRSCYTRSIFRGLRVDTKPFAFHKKNAYALVMKSHSLIRSQYGTAWVRQSAINELSPTLCGSLTVTLELARL